MEKSRIVCGCSYWRKAIGLGLLIEVRFAGIKICCRRITFE